MSEDIDIEKRNWYAIYTKSRSEKKVSDRLEVEGIGVYCPLREEIRVWSDRKKKVQVPVFPSYVFVFVSEVERLKVLETPGVVNFIFWLGKPAVIRENEIQAIREFLGRYKNASSRPITVQTGQEITVKYGQLKDQKGVVTQVRGDSAILRLDGVGFELFAELNIQDL